MSHYFPMVSSSPPPFDNQSFDDEGDDDFGDFSSSSTAVIDDHAFNDFAFQCNHLDNNVDDENDVNAVGKCDDGVTLNIRPVLLTNGDGDEVSRSSDDLDVETPVDNDKPLGDVIEATVEDVKRAEDAETCAEDAETTAAEEDEADKCAIDAETSSLSETRVDDDEFADFQNVIEASESDFDDFQTFKSAECRLEAEVESEGHLFETNFDAFNDNSFHNEPDDDNDEFGNFESTTQIPGYEPLISASLALIFEKVERRDEDLSLEIVKFEDVLNRKTSTSECVWEKLKDIDNTQALTYHWSSCRSNKLLLHSLHLNSNNFLASAKWANSIPIFAANLGSDPLQPTKAPLGQAEDELTTTNHLHTPQPITNDSVVPPAQFDWGSSGLINPLDGLETEFLGRDFGGAVKPLSPLLDKILSQAAANRTSVKSRQMSSEAKRILDSLQDLSFMQATVLMFPIRDGFDA